MAEKATSPYAGLDKALLRSTQPLPTEVRPTEEAPAPTPQAPRKAMGEEEQARTGAPADARKHAPVDARTQARTDAGVEGGGHASLQEPLYRKLRAKQRLASSTFRFRPEELEELDQVLAEVEEKNGRKISKNDLVRLGLNWLLADYKANGEVSMLARVLARD